MRAFWFFCDRRKVNRMTQARRKDDLPLVELSVRLREMDETLKRMQELLRR